MKSLSEKVTSNRGLKDGKGSIIDEPREGIEDRENSSKKCSANEVLCSLAKTRLLWFKDVNKATRVRRCRC